MVNREELKELKEAFHNILDMLGGEDEDSLSDQEILESIANENQTIFEWAFGKDIFEDENYSCSVNKLRERFKELHPDLDPPKILLLERKISNSTMNIYLMTEITRMYYKELK